MLNMLKEHFVSKKDAEEETKPRWGRNLSNQEYSYVLATAQAEQHTSDDDLSIPEERLQEYRRRYRKTFKKGSHK